jgi:uncharacterized protein YhfF
MLNLALKRFNVEFKEGSVKNVGATNKEVTAKLFGVDEVEVREFGDRRLKLAFADGEGNEVEIALFPEEARLIRREIESLEEDSPVFE